eukprot:8617561-Alexandrium_andersonii.AAC.1
MSPAETARSLGTLSLIEVAIASSLAGAPIRREGNLLALSQDPCGADPHRPLDGCKHRWLQAAPC